MSTVELDNLTEQDEDCMLLFYLESDELVQRHFSAVVDRDLALLFEGTEIPEDEWAW